MDNKEIKGLSGQQVIESRRKYGENILTPPPSTPWYVKFLRNFTDPLIIILLVAGALSVGISIYEYCFLKDATASVFFEPLGIFVAILLATGLSFYFENKADKEFALLNQVNDDEPVTVIRDGNTVEIPKREVVVGDVVKLNTGDEIPADGQLLEATTLTVDESTLTGEPSTDKTIDPAMFDPHSTYPSNYVLRGTKVMEGHGIMTVDKIGDSTENGKVFVEAKIDNDVKTPLDEQFTRLGDIITKASYIIAALIIVGRCLMYFIEASGPFDVLEFVTYFLQTCMIAVTLIVVSVPEGLPMAVTLSLAYSMRRMLKSNNLVRKLHACETMGATTVICTDKTGTLTQNQMSVNDARFFSLPDGKLGDNVESHIIEEGIAVNSTASLDMSGERPQAIGNPTEGALLLWLNKSGINYQELKSAAPVVGELPFTTERKYMATIVKSAVTGKPTLYVKGAPEIVMGLCKHIAGDESRDEIMKLLLKYQGQAMRTLGFAYQELETVDGIIADNRVNADNLTFLGVVAIADPVRGDVPAAVDEVLGAGINIKIVTGDTPGTATEIGRQIGLWHDSEDGEKNITTGPDIAAMSDDDLEKYAPDWKIIARARPGDKKRLVEALQRRNHVVAVTGDGTNDAPALKAAHVGLSMGDGTSVAKEASDITIIDNSFTSIGRAVMWGRSLYRNIQRFILFQMTVNVVACLVVLAGAFMGTESPLTVTQMLWVNLIMDTLAAVALASLPPSMSVMRDKPRDRNALIITPTMMRLIFGVGVLFFAILFGILFVFKHTDISSLAELIGATWMPTHELTDYQLSLFFTIFVFLQFWNMFNVKVYMTNRSAFHFADCGGFDLILLIILVGQIIIVSVGGQLFSVVPLKIADWITIIVCTSPVVLIGEGYRLISRLRYGAK